MIVFNCKSYLFITIITTSILSLISFGKSVNTEDVNDDKKKVFVFSLIRHGARAPYRTTNNKDITGKEWELNKSELTNVGLRQHYILGLYQKETHKDLLSEKYSLGEMIAFSTDRNRTIQSFLAHFQGLYPDGPTLSKEESDLAFPPLNRDITEAEKKASEEMKGAISKNSINIMPYHLFDNDNYINFPCKGIPEYGEEMNKSIEKNVNEFKTKYQDFLKKQYNWDLSQKDLKELRILFYNYADTYIAQYYEGMTGDIFADKTKEKEFVDDLDKFLSVDYMDGSLGDDNKYISRIRTSRIFNNLINFYFKNRITKTISTVDNDYTSVNPKLLIYSAHDTNISQFMVFLKYALDIPITYSIPFASLYNFELYHKDNGNNEESFTVRITYNGNEVYNKSFVEFKQKVSKALLSSNEIDSFCGFSASSLTIYIIIIVVLSVLIIVMGIYLIVNYLKSDKTNNEIDNRLSGLNVQSNDL